MQYSVIATTEERVWTNIGPRDVTSREELWLAKLGSWTDALAMYEDKLRRDPRDFEAILGCMRCLDAVGEWRRVLDLSDEAWEVMSAPPNHSLRKNIKPRSIRKATKLCAQSAWRLGQWDELEKFASELRSGGSSAQPDGFLNPTSRRDGAVPQIDYDGAFFTSVLHVHRQEWSHAADAIDAARRAMDLRMTALMAESYSRA